MTTETFTMQIVLDEGAKMPTKAHTTDGGFDLYSREDVCIYAGSFYSFATGVHMGIPEGYVGFLKSKSGLNVKHSIQSEGVIDSGYTGELVVKLYNHGDEDYTVKTGDKISQIVFLPIPEINLVQVNELGKTERANDGFGSSGR